MNVRHKWFLWVALPLAEALLFFMVELLFSLYWDRDFGTQFIRPDGSMRWSGMVQSLVVGLILGYMSVAARVELDRMKQKKHARRRYR